MKVIIMYCEHVDLARKLYQVFIMWFSVIPPFNRPIRVRFIAALAASPRAKLSRVRWVGCYHIANMNFYISSIGATIKVPALHEV